MPQVIYTYGPGRYATEQLAGEIAAAGLPAPGYINGSGYPSIGAPAAAIDVYFPEGLTAAQKATLDQVVSGHVPAGPRRPRLLYAIWSDLGNLTAAQKTAVWADLSAGNPPKFTQDRGPNAASLLTLFTLQALGNLSQADKAECKRTAAAVYCLDNPAYLVHPAFDPTLNVPGDEPIP